MLLTHYLKSRKESGFSLTELIITLGLSSILAIAAYKGAAGSMKSSAKTLGESHKNFERTKYTAQIRGEISNTVSLRAFVDGGISFSMLGNQNSTADFVPSGMVPFPGYTKDTLTIRNTNFGLTAKEANVAGNSDFDAIRLAYLPKESETLFLARKVSTGFPYPTSQTDNLDQGILLSSIGNLKVGDFAMISDNASSDLFRISAIDSLSNSLYEIKHSPSTSIWNLAFERDYGENQDLGDAYVQKVKVVTYAYSPNDLTLYRDDHVRDDGFNPKMGSFSAGGEGESLGGLASNWTPIAKGMKEFNIEYLLTENAETRFPTANYPGDGSSDNHLGHPRLLHLRFNLTECKISDELCAPLDLVADPKIFSENTEKYANLIAPENLRRGKGLTAAGIAVDPPFFSEFTRPDPVDEGGGGGESTGPPPCTVDCGGASGGDTEPPVGGGPGGL